MARSLVGCPRSWCGVSIRKDLALWEVVDVTPARDDRCLGEAHKYLVMVVAVTCFLWFGYRLTCKAKSLVMEFGREVTDVTLARDDCPAGAHNHCL